MYPAVGIGGKYAVGKMAEIMIACNEMIFKIQEEVYEASRDLVTMEDIPAVCTSSNTCFGDHLNTMPEKTPINRSTSLPIPPKRKSVRDVRLKQLYQKLMDLQGVGRMEWFKVFMHMSSYMRVLRPVARGKWEEPKKFIQRQTLTLKGPYPGISNVLIVPDNESPCDTYFGRIGRKSSTASIPKCPSITVKNVELEDLEDHERDFYFTSRRVYHNSEKSDSRILCDCLKVVPCSPRGNETRRKQLLGKIPRKYFEKHVYCMD